MSVRDRGVAFQAEVRPQIDVLLRVGYSLTGSRADAEDLVQDTLVRAWRGLDGFDGAHPRAWLLTILRRTYLNSLRRRRPEVTDDVLVLERSRPAFAPRSPSGQPETLVERQLNAELAAAVAGLDERFRSALWLVDVDGLTYAEAAVVLGVPVGTVYSRLSRARDRVRRQVPHLGWSGREDGGRR